LDGEEERSKKSSVWEWGGNSATEGGGGFASLLTSFNSCGQNLRLSLVACDFFGSEWLPVIFLLQFKRSYLTPVKKIQLFQLFQFGIFHFICKNRIYSIPILSNLKLNAISWRSEDSKKSLRNPEIKNKRKMKSHDEKLMNIQQLSLY
jgi:hypothetical protein